MLLSLKLDRKSGTFEDETLKSTSWIFAALMVFGVILEAGSQEPQQAQSPAPPTPEQQAHAKKVNAAIALGEFQVQLEPMSRSAKAAGPNWSPYGTKAPLTREGEKLLGKIAIGERAKYDVVWRLPKAGADAEFWVDANRDGARSENEVAILKGTERRGAIWYSGQIDLSLPLLSGGTRLYPVNYWYVVSPDRKPDDPEVMRWTRRGWLEGEFKFGNQQAHVMITEAKADGVYDKNDAWGLGLQRQEMYRNSSSRLSRHAWLDGVAFQPTQFDPDGRFLSFKAFDPGVTQEEERQQTDPYREDKMLARAKTPVRFATDLKSALADAKRQDKLVFVDFVTDWCGPCKVMDKYVYTSKLAVDTMNSVIAVQLDGDKEKELVERYQVTGYPTMLLLDSDGQVVRRISGYASATRLKALIGTPKQPAQIQQDASR